MTLTLVRDYTSATGVFEACFREVEVDRSHVIVTLISHLTVIFSMYGIL